MFTFLLSFMLCLQAFAWWTDLMVEHAESFLALYAIDMDAALEIQSPESWDSFPLFQLLNDFLRTDCKPMYRAYFMAASGKFMLKQMH